MFARIKKSGKNEYLQIVENYRENKKSKQRVIATLGRLATMQDKGEIERLIRSFSRFSRKSVLLLSHQSNLRTQIKKIGPVLIFDRLWQETGIASILKNQLSERKFEFDVERAVFITVLHRLMSCGSDRNCDYWRRDYKLPGTEELSLHHFYRAMCFLGEEVSDQSKASPFTSRRLKDIIEEELFFSRRDLFSSLEMVFFDTTSIYFEGEGGETLGRNGHSKDHRPDLKQMIIGVLMDNTGTPLCCEMWPGNIADVTTLIPITESVRNRFGVDHFCIVADRGMISNESIQQLESSENTIRYILGVRMRQVNEVKKEVLSRKGRYKEVYPESKDQKEPSPLKVKEVRHNGKRYIVCLNMKQARKDQHDRENILASLQDKLRNGAGSLIGNKGYRKYLKIARKSISINFEKVRYEERFDGKWVLQTNTDLSSEEVALRYKELWMVENIFRKMKSLLETRPVYHRIDEAICGHVFCSFLALVLLKELNRRLESACFHFEWEQIKQDLKSLQEIRIEENGITFAVRSECQGTCSSVFKAVGVAIPSTIKEL
ncbi:MAG: IS1634 family transposase [Candidatus Cloacimonadales bacterium]|nr:IS1634 family transposase [Candidatus Cloacimonadales bacterium]